MIKNKTLIQRTSLDLEDPLGEKIAKELVEGAAGEIPANLIPELLKSAVIDRADPRMTIKNTDDNCSLNVLLDVVFHVSIPAFKESIEIQTAIYAGTFEGKNAQWKALLESCDLKRQ